MNSYSRACCQQCLWRIYRRKICGNLDPLCGIAHSLSNLEFDDGFIQVYNLQALKEVNLSSWTCYSSSSAKSKPNGNSLQNMYVLFETSHLEESEMTETHPDLRVHVLSLGHPVAWRNDDHFDVVVSCSLSGLAGMIDALGQNRLHLGEKLKLKGFATIQPSGLPQPVDEGHHDPEACPDVTAVNITDKKSSKLGNADLPRTSEFGQSFENQQQFSGGSRKKATKPPNILVYCGAEDTSALTFASVKASLSLCVNTDVYIIYHLTHAQMLSAPWVENTALLLLSSCHSLTTEVEQKIEDFVSRNCGSLLSFDTAIESHFADKILVTNTDAARDERQLYTFQLNEDHTVTCLRGNSCYSRNGDGVAEILVPAEDSNMVKGSNQTSADDANTKALILKINIPNGGVVVLSQLILETDSSGSTLDSSAFVALKSSNTARLAALKYVLDSMGMNVSPCATPDLTPCWLLTQKQDVRRKFLSSVHRKLDQASVLQSNTMSLKFLENFEAPTPVSSDLLPVITADGGVDQRWLEGFAERDYWRHLETTKLGQIVLYTDVISSTMPLFDGMVFSLPHGLSPVAIAGRQTSGRGRGGNMWLSPLGCAMFTFPLSFEMDTKIGQRISFLQHLVATAVVHGIRTLPGCQDLDLRLKWPNDIYYGKEMKLGGVIVTATVMGSSIYATIGCGVNVANSDPTICINDIIELSNRSRQCGAEPVPLLTPAGVIARTLMTLERLLAQFERYGHTAFCETYYKYWLHGGIQVRLNLSTGEGQGHGKVIGLDEFGFLLVQKSSGEFISVQPDGNSFDMMQNLVYCKQR
ncbi:hypothetical protein EGW08_005529 [Elysia chlorotica]|uniref:BPL/LPL catalytic domain-containing protein n=1 Tax=Elysia chlorotica TaxID=188477 RepID=A0A3S1BEY9_ELYCH|nr:hypothetical protein EGW08_005529 [Elysia chlorotica]